MENFIIQRIEKPYVGEDCVQLMYTYDRGMAIIKGLIAIKITMNLFFIIVMMKHKMISITQTNM